MANREIREKGPPTGSLARRTLLTALALLVVPLVLHTYFLYRAEYREEVSDIEQDIETLGTGQKALLEEKIAFWQLVLKENLPGYSIRNDPGKESSVRLVQEGKFIEVAGEDKGFDIPTQPLLEQLLEMNVLPYSVEIFLTAQNEPFFGPPKSLFKTFPIGETEIALHLVVEKEKVNKLHVYGVGFRMVLFLLLVGGVGGALVWLLVWRLSKPLEALCHVMHEVSQGNVQKRYISDRMGFEIDALGQRFNETLDAVVAYEEEVAKERALKEILEQELAIGREIQTGLVPRDFNVHGLDVVAGFLPAKEVSGDFYDAFSRSDGKTFFVIADAAGKGISACLYSLGLRSTLRTLAAAGHPLDEIVRGASELFFLDAGQSSMFVTLWAALWDPKEATLEYTCQGHPPALLLKKQGLEELKTEGMALGFAPCTPVVLKAPLSPGDLLLLYTDGIIEAHDAEGKRYGVKRLEIFFQEHQHLPLEEIAKALKQEMAFYAQGIAQHDDITFFLAKQSIAKNSRF